jgi:hypothetical protein
MACDFHPEFLVRLVQMQPMNFCSNAGQRI